MTIDILGVPLSRLGLEESLEASAIRARTRPEVGGYVCFTNVHTVTESQESPNLLEVLRGALLCLADGLPLVWVSRLSQNPIKSRVCGPDFMAHFLDLYPDLTSGFVGGMPGQAEKIAADFRLSATCYSPPMRPFSKEAALDDWNQFIQQNGNKPLPNVVWVGLGAPKQEFWMDIVSKIAPGVTFMGVGAAFDFLSGTKKRAPLWVQKFGLEWLFRLLQEPGRLWRRYFIFNSRFLFLIIREQFQIRTNRNGSL